MLAQMSQNTSSYADLTPISLTASSSTTDAVGDISQSVTLTRINEFNQLVDELAFDEDALDPSSSEEEDEDEDVHVKYPYERKDQFTGIEERIEQRLKANPSKEADEELLELEQMVKEAKEKRKMEKTLANGLVFTKGSIYTCVMCSKAFSTAEKLQEHSAKSHDVSKKQFPCKLCGKAYKYFKNLQDHMALHEKEFQCKDCSLVFQSAASLDTHTAKFHTVQATLDVFCKFCEKLFPEETAKRHIWYCKNKEQILKKKAEKKAQSVPSSPAMSVASYASFASYQPGPSQTPVVSPVVSVVDKSCKVCGESFASRQSMLRHVGRKHPEAKDDPNVISARYVSTESPTHPYACTDCGKRVTTRAALTTHRARFHLDSVRHQCQHCHKAYTVPSELRKHIQRVHEKNGKSGKGVELPDFDSIF